ncbi:Protein IQ-DOMAIN 1 [Triticum urartu]|uniref:Protein IQ-DOMAIN 1 n=1 Tax=Triticum urartu TaxID=4572 RepID=M7Z1W5_TRIUA|nr:Protein IQ-DOMAIN 1 [Triticum urartu]
MGKKVRWFDAVHRILSPSEPDRDEKEDKQFGKSSTSTSSSSAAHQQPPPQPDQQDAAEAKSTGTTSEQNNGGFQVAALAAPVAQQPAEATAVVTPRAPARSREELAAVRIQTACRGYLVRKGYKARAQARLMSLLEGVAVKRQTEDALYSMQMMTRVQTQIYARRVNKDKALKSQVQPKQGPDKTKTGEVWDHTHQSKEQIEATLATKQEAASRRQKALSYAFSHQEHVGASSGGGGDEKETSLRRTTSLRSGEQPRKLSLGTREVDAGETGDAPVTPSYMQATKSVKAKARCASPAAADKAELPERVPLVSSPSMKRRPSPEFPEKQGVSSPRTPRTPSTPGKAKPEIRTKRPPSPRL